MTPFTKLHGIGNDFVFIDLVNRFRDFGDIALLAQGMCDRHKGVGADGLILLERGDHAPFRMTMYNPDGSNGGMCGNGVRCAARLLIEEGHHPLAPFELEVEHRIVSVEPIHPDWIRVNMAHAGLTRGEIGMTGEPSESFIEQPVHGQELMQLGLDGHFLGTAVSMGNPHLVIFCDDVQAVDIHHLGPIIEHLELFPARVNVHFAESPDRRHIRMRPWERSAGPTLACGSGACSVGVAGFLTGRTDREITIHLPGGDLRVEYMPEGEVFMEGSATRVFDGEWAASATRVAAVTG